MKTEKTDILIIGAGPSGTVAAAQLLKSGLSVRIIEKSKFPRFVIGESLIPKCMEAFEEVGLLEVLEKQGFQKKYGAKFIRGNEECVFDFRQQFSTGWHRTWQVPRADFDNVLAREVENRGAQIDFETTITHIDFDSAEPTVFTQNKRGEEHLIKAKFIIDASGYGRVIPRMLGLEKEVNLNERETVFGHFRKSPGAPLTPKGCESNVRGTLRESQSQAHSALFSPREKPTHPLGGRGARKDESQITLVIHQRDLWIWIIPFSNDTTSVGFVGDPKYFEEFQNGENPEKEFRKMISEVPQLRDRFANASLKFEPKSIKGWAVGSEKMYGEGFVLTGNSFGFLDPVFSSGVTFAVESGLSAAKLVCRKLMGETVDWQKEYVEYLEHGFDVFQTYIDAWYDGSLQDIFFFSSQNESLLPNTSLIEIKKQICSVLAGYVWDLNNPYVKRHKKAIRALANTVKIYS